MNFPSIKVLAYSGLEPVRAKSYQLGVFTTKNGNVDCEIIICITERGLRYWIENKLMQPQAITNSILSEFFEKNFVKFKNLLLLVLDKLIKHYKGFPSPLHPTKELFFCFDIFDAIAVCTQFEKFKILFVSFNVNCLEESEPRIVGYIKHELLHIISKLHEDETRTTHLIENYHTQLKNVISQDQETIENGIKRVIKYLKDNRFDHRSIDNLISLFYQESFQIFWNIINDSALGIIAIDLGDMEYIQSAILFDKEHGANLEEELKKICMAISHIKKNVLYERERNFLLAALNLIQFIGCFLSMPYQAIAYGLLGDTYHLKIKRHWWESSHRNEASINIYSFKKVVKKYCSKEVSKGFLRFYDNYLHIVKYQMRNPSMLIPSNKIHNDQSLNHAKEVFLTFIREFTKLFEPFKRYE